MDPLYPQARSLALAHSGPLKPADIMRQLRVGWNQANRLLEELEADRLLGSLWLDGLRYWSVTFAVNPERVAMLRGLRGAMAEGVGLQAEGERGCGVGSSAPRPRPRRARRPASRRHRS